MLDSEVSRHLFRDGDYALVVDRRGRNYMIRLRSSENYQTHLGNFAHDQLIGVEHGTRVTTSRGHVLLAVKPTMADYTRQMPRIATVVYPKDLAAILMFGDVFPGARVLEAGTGSGAMSIALARAVGVEGRVVSYDVRPDMIERARTNVEGILPAVTQLNIKNGDVYEGFEEDGLDRIVLDLPEPWRVVSHASGAMAPGGIFVSFLPTIFQVHELMQALRAEKTFDLFETFEVLLRPWNVDGRSIRPMQRMVSHTGFITTARRCSPKNLLH